MKVPRRGVLNFIDKVQESLSDQVEPVGLDVRASLEPSSVVAAGQVLKLTGLGTAVPATGSDVSHAIVLSGDEQRVLAKLVGIVPASTSASAGEPVTPVNPAEGETSEDTGEGVSHFEPVSATLATVIVGDAQKTVANPTGYAIDASSVFFNGSSPLEIHESVAIADPFTDSSAAPTSTIVSGYSSADKVNRTSVTIGSGGETVVLWFPVWVPADFASLFNGSAAPAFWIRYKATGSGMVTMAFVDSANSAHAGSAAAAAANYTTTSLLYAVVGSSTITRLTLCWLKVTIAGGVGNVIQVENIAQMRYQTRRDFN